MNEGKVREILKRYFVMFHLCVCVCVCGGGSDTIIKIQISQAGS